MNANELADRLESDDRLWFVNEDLMVKICAMLRQQQVEIEALKTYKPSQTLECFFDLAGFKPPAKTLTDEEIKQVMSKFYSYNPRLLEFARAILRKAQEK